MKFLNWFLFVMVAGCAPTIACPPSPIAQTPIVRQAEGRVTIQPKTVKLVRGKQGQEYPNYKEATIQYPQITGLKNPAVLRKVQDAVSLKAVLGQSIEEMRQEFQKSWWLSEISYEVNYNKNNLLDITFTRSGVGAYPSSSDHHVVVDLKTGKTLKAADIFKRESLNSVAALANRALQADVQQKISEINASKPSEDASWILSQVNDKTFQVKDLDTFSVSDRGITFIYDYGFPHVAKALEPSGRLFLSYQQLKSYLLPEGAIRVQQNF